MYNILEFDTEFGIPAVVTEDDATAEDKFQQSASVEAAEASVKLVLASDTTLDEYPDYFNALRAPVARRDQLKWQRLEPYETFATMIDKHWNGIAAYCHPNSKVALGYVEGLNNKIRVLQRRACGLRDEDYLRLKVLTCALPTI